MSNIFGYMKEL